MKHIRQSKKYSCGAASIASILDISELEAARGCKTTHKGTVTGYVCKFLESKNIKFKRIFVGLPYECVFGHLRLLSNQYKIYVSANFICNSGRGRNSHRHHAFALNKSKIFDPSEQKEEEMDCIGHLYNRDLIIKEIILVGFEE